MTTSTRTRVLTADQLERQRFCSIADAAVYLGRSYQHAHDLVRRQKIGSVYEGDKPGSRRMVVVKDLVKYADSLSIDPPVAS